MTWWHQGIFQYRPASAQRTPVHTMYMFNNRVRGDVLENQNVEFGTFPVVEEAFYWYRYEMPEEGEIIKARLHTHPLGLECGLLFRAEPHELGLDKFKLGISPSGCGSAEFQVPKPDTRCLPVSLREAGFASFHSLRKEVLRNLALSQSINVSKGSDKPELACEVWPKNEMVKGYAYDRRCPTCCKKAKFCKGQKRSHNSSLFQR